MDGIAGRCDTVDLAAVGGDGGGIDDDTTTSIVTADAAAAASVKEEDCEEGFPGEERHGVDNNNIATHNL
jgi:hypothetical protein